MFLGGRGPGRVRSGSLEGRRKRGVFSAVRTFPAGASCPPGKLTSLVSLARRLSCCRRLSGASSSGEGCLSSAACVSGHPRVPSPPTQVHQVFGPDPSPPSLPISSHAPPTKRWGLLAALW